MATLPSTEAIGASEIRAHLDRILSSETLRKAPNLCHLLDYVVTKWAEGNAHHIKESVIAIEVFARRADFDGRIDNIVRVQAHRLRKLLETYYAEEGRHEPLRLCIPRGSYVPHIALAEAPCEVEIGSPAPLRNAPQGADERASTAEDSGPVFASELTLPRTSPGEEQHLPAANGQSRSRRLAGYAAVFLAGVIVAAVALRLAPARGLANHAQPPASDLQNAPDPAVTEIWKGIFEADVKTTIAFTSPSFLHIGRSQAYLLYHGPLSAPEGAAMVAAEHDPYVDKQFLPKGEKLYFNNGWTGTGEVLAVNRLTSLAAQFRQAPSVIPSRALTLGDARTGNVIFIGAPIMNGMIAKIGTESAPIYTTDGKILFRQPSPGEPSIYENIADPATGQMRTCYALFSVLPGVDDSRKIVSSAGLGSWATWGAIDFLTRSSGAAQLARLLKAANQGKLPRFYQTVIRIDIIDGSVANQTLIATRVVRP
jgi:hypothetical protein